MAEVRPWIGSYVSVAQFRVQRDLRVINCVTGKHRIMIYAEEPEPEERAAAVWQDIDQAFSRPVTSQDDTADYAPTQVLAEFFRESGLDGVAFGSALGAGHNIVLFDMAAAHLVNCSLFEIKGVTLTQSEAANPYFESFGNDGPDGV